MWRILTYCGPKLDGKTEVNLERTNQDGLLTYKKRGYKVGNAGIELSQITGLSSGERVACVGN